MSEMVDGEIFHVDDAQCRLGEGRHPHETNNKAEIEEYWQIQKAGKPDLYNGETVLGAAWYLDGKLLHIECLPISYAALLHWLATPAPPDTQTSGKAVHFFASAVLISSDGKILTGRMSEHTANAGRVYMPSGSMELCDFRDGNGDFHANMRREVLEEAGIDIEAAEAEPRFSVYSGRGILALFRQYRFSLSSAQMLERAQAHLKTGT
ncbi:MAG: NUDIX hydrolase, partial [Pseudomonadota bacterium]